MYLLEDARRETERVSNEDGAARLMEPLEALVRGSQFGDDRFEHQLQPTPRVPDIRVSRDRVVLFDRGRLVKHQPCLPHDVGEGPRGGDDHLMSASLERATDADERVDISARTDGGHDETHQCKVNHMTQLSTIGQIATAVKDLDRAVAFYRDKLGMRFLFQVPPGLAFFDCGGVRLMIEVPPDKEFDHPGSVLYFKVTDIDAAYGDLKARGVDFRDAPHLIAKMPDHELWMAFFRDGEGNTLALMHEKRG